MFLWLPSIHLYLTTFPALEKRNKKMGHQLFETYFGPLKTMQALDQVLGWIAAPGPRYPLTLTYTSTPSAGLLATYCNYSATCDIGLHCMQLDVYMCIGIDYCMSVLEYSFIANTYSKLLVCRTH